MGNYKIIHDRDNCIGCGSCVAVAPSFWEMEDDNKSRLVKSQKVGKKFELEIEDKDLEINLDAAKTCPVNVIHIVNKNTGEELI